MFEVFYFFEFSKNRTIWLKNTKMGRIFSSVLALKDFLSNSKIAIHFLKIGSVNRTPNLEIDSLGILHAALANLAFSPRDVCT